MTPEIFIKLCQDALSTLTQKNTENTEHIYDALLQKYLLLPKITSQNETPMLLYAHCMFFAAKAERYWTYFNFEEFNLAALNIMLLAEHCYSLYKTETPPIEALLIRNRHALVSSRMPLVLSRLSEAQEICPCALCKSKIPDKTNSHLIPQMLIHNLVNYTPTSKRDYECIIEENDAKAERRLYYGRAINNDIIDTMGYRRRTEEEIEFASYIPNPATRDFLFCHECEDRFTAIENRYKMLQDKLTKWGEQQLRLPPNKRKNPQYDFRIPYLFWLSVIWRMSVGEMAIKLSLEEEEKIRQILDKCIIDKNTLDLDKLEAEDHCFYYTHEICPEYAKYNEPICITGRRDSSNPYVLITGNHIINFYSDFNTAKEMRDKNLIPPLLNGQGPEIVSLIPFTTFWERLYWARFHNVIYNQKHLGESDIKDIIKYSGKFNPATITPLPLAFGDHILLNGAYPLVVAWNLLPFFQTLNEHPGMPIEELVKGSIYTPQELGFMLGTYDNFNKYVKNELDTFYKSKQLDTTHQQLPLTFAEYNHDNFDFYRDFPIKLR